MQNWEQIEDQKYSFLYENDYPIGDPMRLVKKYQISKKSSCIDLGCGRASLSNYFDNYTGVDVSEFIIGQNKKNRKGVYFHKSLASLEDLTNHYNCAICSDVMEHIPPEHVDSVLASMSKLNADIFYFAISTRKSVFLDNNGENLHLTVLPAHDWRNKILANFIILNEETSGSLWICKAIKKQNSVIIVGNGSTMLTMAAGSLIDSFDTVVRFNSFKIQNFEKFVGTKTDVWFTVNAAHEKEILNFKEVIIHTWQWDKDKCLLFKRLTAYRNCEKTEREFVRNIPCKDPSTGLIAIFYFLQRYQHVIITGFDWWHTEKHHYGDNEVRGNLHKPQIEHQIIMNLAADHKVSFL
jgi:Glycosyltransferase family 29 (sialyltransferase)/Methyltransferase domain